ncbi:hypothetical protein [Hyphomicrobium sp.]|uniref:hypothetical protein n=1 Tax=Hyphomicrobium sp. TaxID=82 RepID=UPI002E35FBD9|nr:hypothetical protein [Hyphomicrobium sp.]HEX2841053.1 hypothetical protein [Hyphomicrobium sp.]
MTDHVVIVLDGPDKPARQFALLYPERGQRVAFEIANEIVGAQISEMVEMENGFSFDLRGTFSTGPLRGQPFHGSYSVASRTGSLVLYG